MSANTTQDYNLLKKQYKNAIHKSSQWEYSLKGRFNEDQELDIISMVSYWDNQINGFGHLNDEIHMQSIQEEDINNILYKEAKIGFGYSKVCNELRHRLKELDTKHNKNKKKVHAAL